MAAKAIRARITPEGRAYIFARAIESRHIPRTQLAMTLQDELENKRMDVPEVEVLERMISKARNHPNTPEDKPWSIAASVKYGFPPEVNRELFDIWRASLAMGNPISIRQAKWILHIRILFYTISTGNMYSDKVNRNLWLIRQSWLYSILERVSEIEEKGFDTIDLDAASFMPNWEHATSVKLGKVSRIEFPQEALDKIGENGTSLTSPPHSVVSVEQAVWHKVRNREIVELGEKALPEEADLVCAYCLNYLSKGPKWKSLRYSEQKEVRFRLLESVEKCFELLSKTSPLPMPHELSARDIIENVEIPSGILKKMVGYVVSPEDLKLYAKLHENELKQEHLGRDLIPAEVQQRLINDEQTFDDLDTLLDTLEEADNQAKIKQKQREEEFLELVQQKGGPPDNKEGHKTVEDFWTSIRDELVKKYPEYKETIYGYLQWREVKAEYERIIEEQKKEAKQ